MAVAAAALPELSRSALSRSDAGRRHVLSSRLDAGMGRITALVVPTALGYLVIGDLITGALFRSGAFGAIDTLVVWMVLAGYTTGLLASTSSRLLQSALYGVGDPRTPSRVAIVRVVVSAALGAVLMLQLDRVAITPGGFQVLGELPALG